MNARPWVLAPRNAESVRALSRESDVSPITAQVLLVRGVTTAREVRRFCNPDLEQLHDPFLFEDMDVACHRIRAALAAGEKVGIFGDYDVDGIAGSSLLKRFFRLLGQEAETYIPHRTQEGYGLSSASIDDLSRRGVKLLITVDCGTTALEEVRHASSLGLDTIILDHHEPGPDLPEALAIINPKRPGTSYPFQGVCSGGLAFKLAWALSRDMPVDWKKSDRYRQFLLDAFALVTLATVADVSPLVDENRVLVRFGMEAMRAVPNLGLRLLLDKACSSGRPVSEFDIAFKLAPRLNAIGRMGHAKDALELFTSDDEESVRRILTQSEAQNRRRKKEEAGIMEAALLEVEREFKPGRDSAIVVAAAGWHPGIVGIIAARLVDRFACPAVVLSIQGARAKGSARSVDGFNLVRALEECREAVSGLRCGGHAAAAGLELPATQLEALKVRFAEAARRALPVSRQPQLAVDDEVTLGAVTAPVCRELSRLSPHGMGNPEPILAAKRVRLHGEPRVMKERHVSFFAADAGRSARVVAFGMVELAEELSRHEAYDIAFTPRIDALAPNQTELVLKGIRLAGS